MPHTTVNQFYKHLFHSKTYKLSLDSGCTCPTRDGTLDTRGCIFCSNSGSGDFTAKTVEEAKKVVAGKLKNSAEIKYIAYFQNFTNTYGDLNRLEKQWRQALNCDGVVGLALGTRPDCISDECLTVLGWLAEEKFVQIELGLQTSNENTAKYIRRYFTNETYINAVKRLHQTNPKIHIVTHIIFGLPYETQEDMMNSIKLALNAGTDGIKITSLYILKGTDLEQDYINKKVRPIEEEEYYNLLKNALNLIPENVIIHRLTGDPPKSLLIEPKWTMNKKKVINRINQILCK